MKHTQISDSDLGLLLRCYWSKGGGARGSDAANKRMLNIGLIEKKGMNWQTHNETIYGHRYNITEKGKAFLKRGEIDNDKEVSNKR